MGTDDFFKEVFPEIAPRLTGIVSPIKLFRYDKGSDRYYYQRSGQVSKAYLSVTSFTSKSLPTSPFLTRWVGDLGNDAAEFMRDMKASYGTFMHIECLEILKKGGGSFEEISQRAFDQAMHGGYKTYAEQWMEDIVKDVLAFITFLKEKEVEVIAGEFPIASDKYLLGGCIDIICSLKFGHGRVNAILDLKSGRKGFWDSHQLQLACYKELWNEWFKDIFPVTHIFNFAPTDWRKEPKYKLENQTENPFSETVRDRMILARREGWIDPPTAHTMYVGSFELENFNLENHIVKISI